MRFPTRLPGLPLIAVLAALAGCTTPHAGDFHAAEADRWEGTNRKIYNLNKGIDRYALRPAANVYRTVLPLPARHGISNAFSNYGEPSSFVNAVLQGKIKQAFRTMDRFILNTTIGVGGLADHATDLGRPKESEDFDQTFATWGIPSGPYLVIPFFGPSTVRGGFGLAADFAFDPANYARNALSNPTFVWQVGQTLTRVVDLRARVSDQGGDSLLAGSLDEYTLVKSAYLQNRRNAIWDGNPPPEPEDELPDEAAPEGTVPPAPAPQ